MEYRLLKVGTLKFVAGGEDAPFELGREGGVGVACRDSRPDATACGVSSSDIRVMPG